MIIEIRLTHKGGAQESAIWSQARPELANYWAPAPFLAEVAYRILAEDNQSETLDLAAPWVVVEKGRN